MSPTSGDLEGLRPDEFGVELRLAVFKEHGNHLSRFWRSSSIVAPWECAPRHPGTYPT